MPLVSSGHLSQLSFLPGSFVNLLTGRAEEKGKKIPCLRINMAAEPKTWVCSQHHSHSESKAQHWNSSWEEINSSLAEARTMGLGYNCWIVCLLISGFCKMGLWFINSLCPASAMYLSFSTRQFPDFFFLRKTQPCWTQSLLSVLQAFIPLKPLISSASPCTNSLLFARKTQPRWTQKLGSTL